MKTKTETTAQEVLRLLSTVPANRWDRLGYINDDQTKCCALGHLFRLKYKQGKYNFTRSECHPHPINKLAEKFIQERYGIPAKCLASVNDSKSVNNYNQKGIKARVIALLKDMAKAGY